MLGLSELLSVYSCCVELSILSDVEMELCITRYVHFSAVLLFKFDFTFLFRNHFMCSVVRFPLQNK